MGHLIVKDNALVEASHRLNEVEQRLVLLAILKIREKFDDVESAQNQELTIHADDYMQIFNVDRHAAYKALKKAVVGLYRAEWGYKYINARGNVAVRYERFTQSAEYVEKEAHVKFMFSNAIIPMLVQLERNFTIYEIEQIANLSSRYSMRLFSLLMRFFDKKTGHGWMEVSLDELRFKFKLLDHEYARMGNFKDKVLDLSVAQINENTDYTVTYEQRKQGRKIVAFRFDMVAKKKISSKQKNDNQRDTNTVDMFDNLTDKEREIVAQKNSYADSINATEQHRKNLINKALEQHRQAENEAKIERKSKAEAKKEAKIKDDAELAHAMQVYERLLNADDDTIAKFLHANERFLSAISAERYYYDRADYHMCLMSIKHRFEFLPNFRALDLSVLRDK